MVASAPIAEAVPTAKTAAILAAWLRWALRSGAEVLLVTELSLFKLALLVVDLVPSPSGGVSRTILPLSPRDAFSVTTAACGITLPAGSIVPVMVVTLALSGL